MCKFYKTTMCVSRESSDLKNLDTVSDPAFLLSCIFSAIKAGKAAAEEREDALQGSLRVRQGEGRPAFSTGPQRQQWGRGGRVFGEGALGHRGEREICTHTHAVRYSYAQACLSNLVNHFPLNKGSS